MPVPHAAPQLAGAFGKPQMFVAVLGELQLQPAACTKPNTVKTSNPERSVAVIRLR
jgi:hypothetical protein